MKNKKILAIGFAIVLGVLLHGGKASAATKTWVGTDCTATSDCNWSTGTNWQGGSAPSNGDDIVINGDTSVDSNTLNDIVGLSVASITTSGYDPDGSGDGEVVITTNSALTITGNITHSAPAVAAPSGYTNQQVLYISGLVVLGGDVTATNVKFSYKTNPTETLTLGGNTLTFAGTSLYTETTIGIDLLLSGSGTFNVNLPNTVTLFLENGNNYSGTTNLNTVNYVTTLDGLVTAFGSSTINVGPSARILFSSDGNTTITNPINVSPPAVTGTFLNNQLEFWSNTTAVNYTIPNITLDGNARFGVNDIGGAVAVNLAGITTNGHCIQYGDENSDAANFTNGPTACTVNLNGQAVPKTPDTGFGLLMNNPAAILGATTVAALGILYIAHRYKLAPKRSRR